MSGPGHTQPWERARLVGGSARRWRFACIFATACLLGVPAAAAASSCASEDDAEAASLLHTPRRAAARPPAEALVASAASPVNASQGAAANASQGLQAGPRAGGLPPAEVIAATAGVEAELLRRKEEQRLDREIPEAPRAAAGEGADLLRRKEDQDLDGKMPEAPRVAAGEAADLLRRKEEQDLSRELPEVARARWRQGVNQTNGVWDGGQILLLADMLTRQKSGFGLLTFVCPVLMCATLACMLARAGEASPGAPPRRPSARWVGPQKTGAYTSETLPMLGSASLVPPNTYARQTWSPSRGAAYSSETLLAAGTSPVFPQPASRHTLSGSSRQVTFSLGGGDLAAGAGPLTSGVNRPSLAALSASGRPSQMAQQSAPSSAVGRFSHNVNGRAPPPLCPALVLQDCTSRFDFPLAFVREAGMRDSVEFDIDGPLRNALFRASVCAVPGGRALGVSMPSQGTQPWALVRPLQQEHAPLLDGMLPGQAAPHSRPLEIAGVDGAWYGVIISHFGGAENFVIHRSMAAFKLTHDRLSHEVRAVSTTGQDVAAAAPTADGRARLELRVEPGQDPLLLLACVLAVMVLV